MRQWIGLLRQRQAPLCIKQFSPPVGDLIMLSFYNGQNVLFNSESVTDTVFDHQC
jgi:hypothetical protein